VSPASPGARTSSSKWPAIGKTVLLLTFLYLFLVSIGMLGKSFKLFGGGLVDEVIQSASFPLVGLFVGILATTLVQSSSTTTSIVVALVGSGTMPVATAIPVIMGANIGTSVTNTLVSLGHLTRGNEYNRAIAASTVHDFFNISAVLVLFPLQLSTNFLGHLASGLADMFRQVGGFTFTSPLKAVTGPSVQWIAGLLRDYPWALLLLALVIMFGSLRYLVTTLKSLVMYKVEAIFDVVLFKNAWRALLFGLCLTVLVQSSSVTTSLVIPLAGAGLLSLGQIFPYTLGANVGTTITAILAALAVGEISAITVAFAHLSFNITGILVIWPVRFVRQIPMKLATRFGAAAQRNRWLPMVYIFTVFYVLPLILIVTLR
jgi:sodium-dependent phosphate cotransporter